MKCQHCLEAFFPDTIATQLGFRTTPKVLIGKSLPKSFSAIAHCTTCPSCLRGNISIQLSPAGSQSIYYQAYPRGGAYQNAPPETPPNISVDYTEANSVLSISAKASAALSRRCLHAILSDAGYKSKNLLDQINAAIDETDASRAIPSSLRDSMDAIRNFGNFSAHPLTDKLLFKL